VSGKQIEFVEDLFVLERRKASTDCTCLVAVIARLFAMLEGADWQCRDVFRSQRRVRSSATTVPTRGISPFVLLNSGCDRKCSCSNPHGKVTRGNVAMTLVDLMVRDTALITYPVFEEGRVAMACGLSLGYIEVDVAGLSEETVNLIAAKLRQFPCVLNAYWHHA
jgi:hypothetical protein